MTQRFILRPINSFLSTQSPAIYLNRPMNLFCVLACLFDIWNAPKSNNPFKSGGPIGYEATRPKPAIEFCFWLSILVDPVSQRLFQSSKWESLSTQAWDLFADCWNPNWWGVFVSPTRLDTSKSISPHVVWTRSCLWNRRAGSRAPCRSYNWLRSVLEKDDQVDDLKTPTDHQQTLRFSSTRVWKFSWKSCPHVTRSF